MRKLWVIITGLVALLYMLFFVTDIVSKSIIGFAIVGVLTIGFVVCSDIDDKNNKGE